MTIAKMFAGVFAFLLFASFSVSASAQNRQPNLPPGIGAQSGSGSASEEAINKVRKRFLPSDSTDQEQNVEADGYAPLYIVTKTQRVDFPGYIMVATKDRNGNIVQLSNPTNFTACAADEQTNDTVKRVKFGPSYLWFTQLRAGGCTSAAICGACFTWSSSFTPSCNPQECGNTAWYGGNPTITNNRALINNRGVLEAYKALPFHNGSGTAKYCGQNIVQSEYGYWAYGEIVDKNTPLGPNVRDMAVSRTCYITEWAKTTPDR